MEKIVEVWMELVRETMGEGYMLGNQGREVYKQWEGFLSENNQTELQIGIESKKLWYLKIILFSIRVFRPSPPDRLDQIYRA